LVGAIYAGVANPYSTLWPTAPAYEYRLDASGQFTLEEKVAPRFCKTPFLFHYLSLQSLQAIFRILDDAWLAGEKPIPGSAAEVIARIHEQRFDPGKPYVISGSHFSELYTRNLGIFYNAALDPRFALSAADWTARQQSITSTLALHLSLLEQADREYTTLYPIWPNIYSGVNVYAEPSDTLFAIFYTLRAMTDVNFIAARFPAKMDIPPHPLQTQRIGKELLERHRGLLKIRIENYLSHIINPETGLVRQDILLSSARDQIKRQSSFYDNVIAWGSVRMATDLGLVIQCPAILQNDGHCDFDKWKQLIVSAFWDDTTGIFIDDLSPLSRAEKSFSADSFIILSSGFLDLRLRKEREMLMRIRDYIVARGLDKPLPLRYADKDHPERLYPLVRAFAASYMGETHWSHWGMEYIKGLILLAEYDRKYMEEARAALETYRQKIEEYGGYPELYDTDGKMYHVWCYKSMLQTGWVVNYEQAQMMAGEQASW